MKWLSDLLDWISPFLAHRKGLLPLLGMGLIIINLILHFIPGLEWFANIDLFLHLGVLVAIFGFLLAFAL